jgi:catechol 2,3-dioxygenase-like lactoylglutathione lyase family enzyme
MALPTFGIRHVALNVRDAQRSKEFYQRVFGMQLEWEPDPANVYLTSQGHDNLAIHQAAGLGQEPAEASAGQSLDHIGFAVPTHADVDAWWAHIQKEKVEVAREIKTHRDGAHSFYVKDPDGIVIQVISHPPISRKANPQAAG